MDQVFPDLNNAARHIRPFVLVTWAWRRAHQLVQNQADRTISSELMRDFVDRIEVIYVWSQFQVNPSADLPGRRVLTNFLRAKKWTFGSTTWFQPRQTWRFSTALTAPVNYGPALKMLGWLQPHQKYPEILIPTPAAAPALDAFEARIADRLNHPAFSQFGRVTITSAEVRRWSKAWALSSITKAEKDVMKEMLLGANAPLCRQLGGELMLAAAKHASTTDIDVLRAAMAGPPSSFKPATHLLNIWQAWRRLQVRQLFRLSLEAWLNWILTVLGLTPKTTNTLVNSFLDRIPGGVKHTTTSRWLAAVNPHKAGPTELMDEISGALGSSSSNLPRSIIRAIAFCLAQAPDKEEPFERDDRLPLSRARDETLVRQDGPPKDFVRHIFESWILAQHVYWSVGRGLGDARSQGKTLLRLKVILDEGGWVLAPGVSAGAPPVPTPDRLHTMVTLASECGLL